MTALLDSPQTVAPWVAERLEEAGLPYAIGGALALAVHGLPRMTTDVDIGVFVQDGELDTLLDALERAGCVFDRIRAAADVARMNLFTVRCGTIFVDLFVSFHSHHHEAMARRVRLVGPFGGEHWYLSAEDLAVHKLALHRGKDLVDLERLFAVQGDRLDVDYIRRWVHAIAPDVGDPRRALLADLVARFHARPT